MKGQKPNNTYSKNLRPAVWIPPIGQGGLAAQGPGFRAWGIPTFLVEKSLSASEKLIFPHRHSGEGRNPSPVRSMDDRHSSL
jgi:hypothetical protein